MQLREHRLQYICQSLTRPLNLQGLDGGHTRRVASWKGCAPSRARLRSELHTDERLLRVHQSFAGPSFGPLEQAPGSNGKAFRSPGERVRVSRLQ